jgi:tetratricopeptide (TPR) repeat protein
MADYGWMDPSEAGSLAKVYAAKAVEIDDTLAEAHASLGLTLLNHSWDFDSAERELKRAIELRPNYPAAYHWYAILLAFLNKYEEAFEMSNRASILDPYSRVVNMSKGVNLYYLRKYDQALEQLEKVIDSNPDFGAAHLWKSLVYVELHKFEDSMQEGMKAVEMDNGSALTKLNLAWIYACAKDKESATKLMNEVISEKRGYTSPGSLAQVKLALGEEDDGFALLEKARQTRDTFILYLRGSPNFVQYQSDPRWLAIERKMGLPKS